MRALTLWQPWAHAIAHLGKRLELSLPVARAVRAAAFDIA